MLKTIRFQFDCSRAVPLYARLCNQFLNNETLDITVGLNNHLYFIEASGTVAQLEQLADRVASHFLISIWLVESSIVIIDTEQGETRQGGKIPLIEELLEQEFCQLCHPKLGDNQSPEFGNITLPCTCCQGETRLNLLHQELNIEQLDLIAEQLLQQTGIDFPSTDKLTLSTQPIPSKTRQQLLYCNPNTLNGQFQVNEQQVLALSSIEKPIITLKPIDAHPTLTAPLYDLIFPYNRALAILCERLRQKGVDWLYLDNLSSDKAIVWVQDGWSQVGHTDKLLLESPFTAEPLHDSASFGALTAHYSNNRLQCAKRSSAQQPISNDDNAEKAATCALLCGELEHNQFDNSAILYNSQQHGFSIITKDKQGMTELFFSLPELPDNGYELYHQLESSPQKLLVKKFKEQFPDDYLRLLDLKLTIPTNNLKSLWAIAAIILGLNTQTDTPDELYDTLIAKAMGHRQANAPRIDFPLTKGEAYRKLNWCKTLATLISFRLAGDNDYNKLAFALQDSLADFIANWIEHLDLNIGINQVFLAGSELANTVLTERLTLRVGKNFPIKVNREIALDSDNLAIGALYLKKRRKFLQAS